MHKCTDLKIRTDEETKTKCKRKKKEIENDC